MSSGHASKKHSLKKWTLQSSDVFCETPFYKILENKVRSASNTEAKWYILDLPDWVNIVAIDGDDVLFVQQYRHGSQEFSLEIPGGIVDPGETHLEAAKRELLEETGFSANKWVEIGRLSPNPALQNNLCVTFLAIDVEDSGQTHFDEHEELQTQRIPLYEIDDLCSKEKIHHALVVAAFDHLRRYNSKS